MKSYKCYIPDETSSELHNVAKECYLKSEVDAVINDLKAKLEAADKASTNLVDKLADQRIQIAELKKQVRDMIPLPKEP